MMGRGPMRTTFAVGKLTRTTDRDRRAWTLEPAAHPGSLGHASAGRASRDATDSTASATIHWAPGRQPQTAVSPGSTPAAGAPGRPGPPASTDSAAALTAASRKVRPPRHVEAAPALRSVAVLAASLDSTLQHVQDGAAFSVGLAARSPSSG